MGQCSSRDDTIITKLVPHDTTATDLSAKPKPVVSSVVQPPLVKLVKIDVPEVSDVKNVKKNSKTVPAISAVGMAPSSLSFLFTALSSGMPFFKLYNGIIHIF